MSSTDDLIRRLQTLVEEEKEMRQQKLKESAGSDNVPPIRILVMGVDASQYSREAVNWARQNNYITPNDILVLATVWEEALEQYITNVDMGLYAGLVSLNHDEIRKHNEDALGSARNMLQNFYHNYLSDCDVFPLIVSSSNVSKSAIGDILCKTADSLNATAILIGCHGHGAFKRFFLGSVSKFVVENARCPVLVVKH